MALRECPECGTVASTEATFCPQCGFPIRKAGEQGATSPASAPFLSLTFLDVIKSLIGRVLVGAGMFATGVAADAPPGVLLALVVWGSAVPLYLKARKAHRLGPPGGHGQIQATVQRELAAARDEVRGELAGIDANTSRIAELEERIDFMERLLAKYREEGRQR